MRLDYAKNREKRIESSRNYRLSPEAKILRRLWDTKRRAKRLKNHSAPYSPEQVEQLKSEFTHCCAYCGKTGEITLDHFIPVSSGGPDCLGNLVPACRSCNSSKHVRNALEWYKDQPFYSRVRWKKILKILGKTEVSCEQLPLF